MERRVVYSVSGMDRVTVRADVIYKRVGDLELRFDVYLPAEHVAGSLYPAVVFINGDGPPELLLHAKDWGQYTSWGRLAAAAGLIGVTFNHRSSERWTRLPDAAADISDLFTHLHNRGREFGIDSRRLCAWVCSGGGPLALPALISNPPDFVRCVVVYYARLDLQPARDLIPSSVDDQTLRTFSPIYRLEHATRLPPTLLVRAGRDRPELNDALDRFVFLALSKNLPVEVMNHPNGQHGFDTRDDVARSREIVRRTLEFMRAHLTNDRM